MCGTETLLIALLEEPEWVKDMFNTYLDQCIAHTDMVWNAGFHFDSIGWPDDMGYRGTPFFSETVYRELLQPVHKRAVDWDMPMESMHICIPAATLCRWFRLSWKPG